MGAAGRAFVERWAVTGRRRRALRGPLRRAASRARGADRSPPRVDLAFAPMGKASSAKKVARAARAGGSRQRRPAAGAGVPRRDRRRDRRRPAARGVRPETRDADAFPKANEDHVHSSIDIYRGADGAAATTTATSTTATTWQPPTRRRSRRRPLPTSPTATTQADPSDVHGRSRTPDAAGRPARHPHPRRRRDPHPPVHRSAAGRQRRRLGVFLEQVGISMTNDTLTLPQRRRTFTEGTTKCRGRQGRPAAGRASGRLDERGRGRASRRRSSPRTSTTSVSDDERVVTRSRSCPRAPTIPRAVRRRRDRRRQRDRRPGTATHDTGPSERRAGDDRAAVRAPRRSTDRERQRPTTPVAAGDERTRRPAAP